MMPAFTQEITWNPWHGCHKLSEGCRHCYVYREDAMFGTGIGSDTVRMTGNFNLPVKRKRDKTYKIESGAMIYTCFTSDFFVEEADEWRIEAWRMIRERSDCNFFIITKRIDRFMVSLPPDWGEGYDNVMIGCTVENQDRADYRLPIFASLPIRHKSIMAAPLLESLDLRSHITGSSIEQVSVSGESGINARPCYYDWILQIRRQCIDASVRFNFHQTGAYLIKDGKTYRIERKYQISQAHCANIDT